MRYRKATSCVGAGELTAGESVLEDLLESQELEDGKVDSWVETESSLVWTESAVKLNSVTVVDLWLKVVVLPDNTELDDALWDRDDFKGGLVLWVLLEERRVLEGRGQLCSDIVSYWSLSDTFESLSYRCKPAQTLARG